MPAAAGEHELIAFGIDAHREMRRFAVFGFRFTSELSTTGDNFLRAGDNIGHLKGESRPGAFAGTAAMDANDRSANHNFTDDLGFLGHFAAENLAVKAQGARHVGGPEDVFHAFDIHAPLFYTPARIVSMPAKSRRGV
jgi:hypothetical protein